MSDRDVRELAEKIFEQVTVEDGVDGIEDRLRDFFADRGWLAAAIEDARHRSTEIPPWAKGANGPQREAQREAEQAGALAALRGALEQVGDLVAAEDVSWEVVGLQAENIIRAALASDAGKAEAEVLRQVGLCFDHPNCDWTGFEPLADAWEALRAARGGEG